MIDRRQWLTSCALAALAGRASARGADQVPLLSGAPPGATEVPGWQHQRLPKVERANAYAIVDDQGQRVLSVQSSDSASSWVAPLDVSPERTPWLGWRWKVSRALPGSDLLRKAGDDYAARLYVFFDLPLERLSWNDRLSIRAARLVSGAELPAAALCYVWGGRQAVGRTAWNPYTDRVRMIVVDSGDAHAGRWRTHARDLRRDWAEAFDGPVPPVSGVGVGADTDNTHDRAEAWFGDLRFFAR